MRNSSLPRPRRAVSRARQVKNPPPILVSALSRTRGALGVAAEMAVEWADPPFSRERLTDAVESWRNLSGSRAEIFVARRGGHDAGLLCAQMGRLWPDGGRIAVAPLVWARGRDAGGARVSTPDRDAATTALSSAFLDWARRREAEGARIVYRPGLAPGAEALEALGLRRMFDVCVRNAILPEDGIPRPSSGGVDSDDVEHWQVEAGERGDPDWVEKKIRERFGWAPLRGKHAPQPARALSPADAARAVELMRGARERRGVEFDEQAFVEWLARIGRRRDAFALGAEADGKLNGILGGWVGAHPLTAGGNLAVAAFMEAESSGGNPPRRIQDSLALGTVLHARGARTVCFVLPVGAGDWGDFQERWRLRLAGNGYGCGLDLAKNEGVGEGETGEKSGNADSA